MTNLFVRVRNPYTKCYRVTAKFSGCSILEEFLKIAETSHVWLYGQSSMYHNRYLSA